MRVPLNGFAIQLRLSELESVAAGLDLSGRGEPINLAEALARLAVNDRAPAWELAVRHLGRHKPLPRAASEIGMDLIRARALMQDLFHALGALAARAPSA